MMRFRFFRLPSERGMMAILSGLLLIRIFSGSSATAATASPASASDSAASAAVAALETRLAALEERAAAWGGPARPIVDDRSDDTRRASPPVVVDAPSNWRYCVVRGRPAVRIEGRGNVLLSMGSPTRYGAIVGVSPDCVRTTTHLLPFADYGATVSADSPRSSIRSVRLGGDNNG